MRILFISTFYPPYVVGGWEQLADDINQRLQARGHTTEVLTSTHGVEAATHEEGVHRVLTMESDLYHYNPSHFFSHKSRLQNNLAQTKAVIETFTPDVVFIHVMFNLSRGIAWMAEKLCPGRVVYYVANDWPHATDPHTAYWRDPANNAVANLAKQVAAQVPLKIIEHENRNFDLAFKRVLCVSKAVKNDLAKNAGIPPENMKVVYNGVETDLFVPSPLSSTPQEAGGELSLVYAGSLVSHKGVHTAIEAMGHLANKGLTDQISLTIIGSGHPDYEDRLQELVIEGDLTESVHFLGRVPREEMPALFQKFDVLLFPSIWEEPLARTTQEAMAAGLTVIGTLTGGTGELLVEGETGLTFAPEDSVALAHRIQELVDNPELCSKLARNGREKVEKLFDIRRMIDEIELYLQDVTAKSPPVQVRQ